MQSQNNTEALMDVPTAKHFPFLRLPAGSYFLFFYSAL